MFGTHTAFECVHTLYGVGGVHGTALPGPASFVSNHSIWLLPDSITKNWSAFSTSWEIYRCGPTTGAAIDMTNIAAVTAFEAALPWGEKLIRYPSLVIQTARKAQLVYEAVDGLGQTVNEWKLLWGGMDKVGPSLATPEWCDYFVSPGTVYQLRHRFVFIVNLPRITLLLFKTIGYSFLVALRFRELSWSLHVESEEVYRTAERTVARNSYLIWREGGQDVVKNCWMWATQQSEESATVTALFEGKQTKWVKEHGNNYNPTPLPLSTIAKSVVTSLWPAAA